MADRTFLQGTKTESTHQDLCRNFVQCCHDSNLDSINRDPDFEISQSKIENKMVLVKSGCNAENELVDLQGFVELGESSIFQSPRSNKIRPGKLCLLKTWTAERQPQIKKAKSD